MAKKLKINFQQTQTIREAFADFLLQKKALGLADKTIDTYSHHFDIISKYLDSSAPIAGLFKRPLDEPEPDAVASDKTANPHDFGDRRQSSCGFFRRFGFAQMFGGLLQTFGCP